MRYDPAPVLSKVKKEVRGSKCIRSNLKDLLNNIMILKKLIKSSGKCNPKSKTYFSFAFHLRNSKSGK